ncbi:MAG TPA: hypothetical protein VFF68_03035 [Anaerolineaceae bacterium]|nr:hypothetical protein [Anaerolineaceae bacterium]
MTELVFNPEDVAVYERLAGLCQFLVAKGEELNRLEAVQAAGSDFEAALAQIAAVREGVERSYAEIDRIFGTGTIAKIFGDRDRELLPALVSQLLEGVMPHFARARTEKVSQYLPPTSGGKKRRRVMK